MERARARPAQHILNRIADDLESNTEELAHLLSREQGKPLDGPNARFEVGACAAWTRNAADTPLEPEIVFEAGDARAEVHYDALGVVGAIGPWNWPMMITVWQIAPSLRMGNTVIVKPSSFTPLSVLALVEVFNRHLPDGVLIVISGDRQVGAALAEHPGIDKIMFTGSTDAGRRIVESSARTSPASPSSSEETTPGIVLPDTKVAAIAENLFWGSFINTGQTCAALKRLYVHDSVYEEVVSALVQACRHDAHGARDRRRQRARPPAESEPVRHRESAHRRRPRPRRAHRRLAAHRHPNSALSSTARPSSPTSLTVPNWSTKNNSVQSSP